MTYQFTPLPEPGDIVWCYFPHQEDGGAPGPKERPALVIRVSEADHAVQVAYGTSKRTHQIYKGEFVMDPAEGGFQISGLSVRTKFDLNRLEQLYFDAEYFAPAPGVHTQSPLPKMGTMHSSYYAELQKAASQIT